MPILGDNEEGVFEFRARTAGFFGVEPTSIKVHGKINGNDFIKCAIDVSSGGMIIEICDS